MSLSMCVTQHAIALYEQPILRLAVLASFCSSHMAGPLHLMSKPKACAKTSSDIENAESTSYIETHHLLSETVNLTSKRCLYKRFREGEFGCMSHRS